MDVFQTLEALGAEIACNRAVVRVDDVRVIVARVVGGEMVLTAEGAELASAAPAQEPTKAPAKRRRARAEDGAVNGDEPVASDVNEAPTDGNS